MRYNIYCNHKSLRYFSSKEELNIRQCRWLKLVKDYDCEIKYYLGKANVIVDGLSRKWFYLGYICKETCSIRFIDNRLRL